MGRCEVGDEGLRDGDVVFVGSWKKVMRYGDVNFWIWGEAHVVGGWNTLCTLS
jgi:hypothetical protein